ncbi:chromosome segregation protein SMC [Selenomonas caprae]|uniref:Chromosome partition protein Smc n=1 Tax=Selenomonas caprae TaxID=2606905 RepID=A0A5D6WGZ0_9FIRM|nr:chromosome segregation protein SMC [Selenomonas caprae]TYZ27057.1 chromosome segregation protein SMC [Selenomonas caprae]
MQLKRLEAYGFKSFADKISIDFDKGITAIVGPNGSGKSNITDAIRWVLGEQNVRNLRGTKAEDIIFTGSASRKALGVAEVSLFFANDGTLPVDFREVVVTRRLYRSGESEFYINRSRCRLKDIYNLFADTGIGHDGMSIIGQNRIDDILNSRPEERRAFFEETAGITKYRNRKRESVRKLTDTENNLVRVQDIINEIENQLEPLARHAEKTRIFNGLNEEYKKCRLTKLAQDYTRESQRKQDNDEKLVAGRDAAVAADTQVKAVAARKEQLGKEIIDFEQQLKKQAEKNEAIRQKIEAASTEMAALKERQEQSDAAKARILSRRSKLNHEIAQAVADMAQWSEKEAQQKKDLALAEELLAKEKEKAKNIAERIREQKEVDKAAGERREQAQAELTQKQQELALIERDIENGSGDQEAREASLQEARQQLQELAQLQQRLQAELAEQDEAIKQRIAEQQSAQKAQREAASRAAGCERRCNETVQQIKSAESKIQFLTRMQQAYEGFGKAAKAVLKCQEGWRKGVAGAVAELIDVPREYVTALEIALGGNLQNIVTEDTDTAKAAIAFLKRERQGRVTFLPLSTIVARPPQAIKFSAQEGVIGWASELVKTEEKYTKIVEFLLSRTLVVDTLDHALALAKKHNYKLRIVTKEGELLNPGGSLSGGSRQHQEASFLNRSGEIEALKQKLADAQAELTTLKADRAAAQQAEQLAARQEEEAREALHEANVHRAELRVSLERLAENQSSQQQAVAELEKAAAEIKATFARIQEKRTLAARAVNEAQRVFDEADHAAEDAAIELEDLEQDADDLSEYIQKREVNRAVLEQEALRSREYLLLRKKDKERSEQALRDNEAEEQQLVAGLAESVTRLEEISGQNANWQRLFTEGQEAHDRIYAQRMTKLTESQQADKDAHEAAKKLNQAQEHVHKLEIIETKLQLALEEWQETILSEYGLTPERALEEALDIEPPEVYRRMKELDKKIKELGPVNPNALEEYEEQQKRHDFMQGQANDLIEAKENLESLIADMDEAMTKQFKEAFAQIQKYFGEIFVRLFGGGKAELKLLDENDVLNTGVDILVTLPQKKRQNLSALSGGERALTVIALLFSFLRYRPSPFSVLDEIDAPLDEANVVRFGSFLTEFSENTQFIVVTHRKGTMEAVDTMYGVTIEDAGVSKILSVKLDDIK